VNAATSWPAISARRTRRNSSSVFPENMQPVTASTQPLRVMARIPTGERAAD